MGSTRRQFRHWDVEFTYQAKNRQGLNIQGKIDAPSEDQAVSILHQKGLVILSFVEARRGLFDRDLKALISRPSKKDIVIFTRQLATLVDADVPLIEGLHTLGRQVQKESFSKVVTGIAAAIEGGASLSLAMAEHRQVFGAFYVSLVRAGEVSGKLQATLTYLADYLEKSAALTSKIKGALSYPIFILVAIFIVSLLVTTVVLPKLLIILKEAGAEDLPLTTRVLIGVTDFVNNYLILLLVVIIGAVVGFFRYLRTEAGRARWDSFKLQVPQFKTLIQNFYLARMTETLSTLIKAGVPILDGLNITAEVVGNTAYRNILLEAKTNVQGGGTISETLSRYQVFPPLVTSMLAIGEKTGRTDFMLDNIAKFYKTEAEDAIQNLTQLIEPVLLLVMGLGVGLLVSAVLLPIYSLVGGG